MKAVGYLYAADAALLRILEEGAAGIVGQPVELYDSRRNHLDWLAYNARRALFDDPEERRIGRQQIADCLSKLAYDQRNRAKILGWMEEALHE